MHALIYARALNVIKLAVVKLRAPQTKAPVKLQLNKRRRAAPRIIHISSAAALKKRNSRIGSGRECAKVRFNQASTHFTTRHHVENAGTGFCAAL